MFKNTDEGWYVEKRPLSKILMKKYVIKDYILKDSRYEKPYVGVGIPFTPISLRIFEM